MRFKALKCKTKTEFLYFSVYLFRFQGQNFLTESKGSEIVAYGRQPVMGAVAPREPLCLRATPEPTPLCHFWMSRHFGHGFFRHTREKLCHFGKI